jgi:hypothetical protein
VITLSLVEFAKVDWVARARHGSDRVLSSGVVVMKSARITRTHASHRSSCVDAQPRKPRDQLLTAFGKEFDRAVLDVARGEAQA